MTCRNVFTAWTPILDLAPPPPGALKPYAADLVDQLGYLERRLDDEDPEFDGKLQAIRELRSAAQGLLDYQDPPRGRGTRRSASTSRTVRSAASARIADRAEAQRARLRGAR